MKKILYHHRTQGKAVEGVHIRGIVDALRAQGCSVDVISPPGADPYAAPQTLSPTRQAKRWMKFVCRLPEPLFELAEMAYNVPAAFRLWRSLRGERRPLFVYERYSLFLFLPAWLARRLGVPVLLEVNDSAVVPRVRPLFFKKLAMLLERRLMRSVNGLVFVSSTFRDRLQAAHGGLAPSIVSPNAANIADFEVAPEERDRTRKKCGLEGSVVCGYLGAFVPWHAIDRFIEEMAPRLKENPRLKLLCVGDGATHAKVGAFVRQSGLEERVILTGRVAHAEVPALVSAMDLAILPSAGDYTSPVKLFEFMAGGVPALAPDYGPIREVLRDGETGWLFPAGDLARAAERLLELSRQPEGLRTTGRAARAYLRDHRQWCHNAEQLFDLFQQVSITRPEALPSQPGGRLQNEFADK